MINAIEKTWWREDETSQVTHAYATLWSISLSCIVKCQIAHGLPQQPSSSDGIGWPEKEKGQTVLKKSCSTERNQIQGVTNNTNNKTLSIHRARGTNNTRSQPRRDDRS